jgi:hypothetical protein
MNRVECADCDGTWEAHARECLTWRAMDRQQRNDRAFFDRYPQVDVRRRKPLLEELMAATIGSGIELPELPDGQRWHAGGYVLVCRTKWPDVRIRRFNNAYLAVDPDAPVKHWIRPKFVAPCTLSVLPEQWAEALFRGPARNAYPY